MDIEEAREEINKQLDMLTNVDNVRIEMVSEPILIAKTEKYGTKYLGGTRKLIIIFERVFTGVELMDGE